MIKLALQLAGQYALLTAVMVVLVVLLDVRIVVLPHVMYSVDLVVPVDAQAVLVDAQAVLVDVVLVLVTVLHKQELVPEIYH